ncbi:MAG: MarR family transcriptional regulator [Myxococcota bacterium]
MNHPPSSGALALIAICRELYAVIDRLDQQAADQVGVSRNDLRALNVLENGPCRAGVLADTLGLTTGSISTLVDRLEKRGLVVRDRDPQDRRAVLIAPTDRLFDELGPLYRQVAVHLANVAEEYSDEELDSALGHLRDVVAAYRSATRESSGG